MTSNELKKLLDDHIYQQAFKKPNDTFLIHLNRQYWVKAKYSCTEEENDFKFIKGKVYYKGFELIAKFPN